VTRSDIANRLSSPETGSVVILIRPGVQTTVQLTDSGSANFRKLNARVSNDVLGADRWSVWRILGAAMAGPVHLKIRSEMCGPFDCCRSRLRPLGGKLGDGLFYTIVGAQRSREAGSVLGGF
jgi:hypothetical protein